jgi:hypothetical protein
VGTVSASEGAAVVQNPYSGAGGQVWQFVDVGGGYFEIKNVGSGKALGVQAGLMVQTAYSAATSMQWTVTDLTGNACKVVNRGSGLALEVPGGSTAAGVQLDQAAYGGGLNQQFVVVALQ